VIYLILWFLSGALFYSILLIIGSYKFGHKFKKDPDLIGLILFIICGPIGIFWCLEHLILKKIKNEKNNIARR